MNHESILSMMVEIELPSSESFLKIKETLTRIGVSNSNSTDKKLFPSVVILHKRGKYYLSHFKFLFGLDGKGININETDITRFYTIVKLVSDWGLCKILNETDSQKCKNSFNPKLVKIVPFSEKANWTIVQKYTVGK